MVQIRGRLLFCFLVTLGAASPARASCDGDIKGGILAETFELMKEWLPIEERACPPGLDNVVSSIAERSPSRPTAINAADGKPAFAEGKVQVIDLWATTCPPCMGSLPEVEKLRLKLGSSADLTFVTHLEGGGQDERRVLNAVRSKRAENLMVSRVVIVKAWSDVEKAYHPYGIPQIVVLDKRGRIAWKGSVKQDVASVVKELNEETLPEGQVCK